MNLIKLIKQFFCKHTDLSLIEIIRTGETCDWAYHIVPYYIHKYRCKNCSQRIDKQYIHYGDKPLENDFDHAARVAMIHSFVCGRKCR